MDNGWKELKTGTWTAWLLSCRLYKTDSLPVNKVIIYDSK